ncbi:hypothetical protein QP028_14015 [Corynebacterium suedekumii]|nr:hypothetical protein QP028_14015 [Corynebacterium suedekumii]
MAGRPGDPARVRPHSRWVVALLTSVRKLLADRAYVSFTTGFIFSFATMFAYVSASPFILQEHYGFSPVQYAMIFAANTTGMFLVALLNAHLVTKVGPLPLARIGNIVMLVATGYLLTVALLDAPRWYILAGLFTVVASMGLNFADNSALAISRAGKAAGSASAFLGSGQFLLAGVLSPIVGLVASAGLSQPVAMAAVMVVTAIIATVGVHSGARALGHVN